MQKDHFVWHMVAVLFLLLSFNLIYSQPKHVELVPGVIIDSVFCINQNNQSYSLYLPIEYREKKKWPVLLVFDPAARGKLGVTVFRQGAERFGYILLCSNNSSNKSGTGSDIAADAMLKDVIARFSADTSQIYCSGFSGGSRFALRYALNNNIVKGVIGCGAGAPREGPGFNLSREPFSYFGLVGNRDLNLQDMIRTQGRMKELFFNTHFQIIEGGHDWPTPEELMLALGWMKIMCNESNDSIQKIYVNARQKQINELINSSRYLDAVIEIEALTNEFASYEELQKLDSLKKLKTYKDQLRKRASAYQKELDRQELYYDAWVVFNYSTPIRPDTIYTYEWWRSEIRRLKKLENSKKVETSRLGSRLLNMIEIRCAENLWSYVDLDQDEKACFIMDVWLQVTPDGLWANWNAAKLYSVLGEKKEALSYIEKIVSSGEAKKEWFMHANEFNALRSDQGFIDLIGNLE